nr:MAG TPA: hypothetical protein [Caudoviricetes sp.]
MHRYQYSRDAVSLQDGSMDILNKKKGAAQNSSAGGSPYKPD